jgi:regulator of protease activity HflC (stomatin/prohibitin superfamily)
MNRLNGLLTTLVLFSALTFSLSGCGTLIDPGHEGLRQLVFREHSLQKEPLTDGFYWHFPWNNIFVYKTTWQSRTEEVHVLTEEALHILVRVTVTYRPKTADLYQLAQTIGPHYYSQVIRPPFVTITRTEFSWHKHNRLGQDSPIIESDILKKLQAALSDMPIVIARVSIDHIEYDRQVTDAISDKIATHQKAEQKVYEEDIAKENADIARTNAQGQADAEDIQATGDAKAILVKAKAKAQAQMEISKTLTKQYIELKAFDNPATRYYFVPTGKDGLPLIINTGSSNSNFNSTTK